MPVVAVQRVLFSPADRCGEGVTGGRVTQQRILKGGVDALNQHSPDQGGSGGASLSRKHPGELSHRAGRGHQQVDGATAGDGPWLGSLVPRGACEH